MKILLKIGLTLSLVGMILGFAVLGGAYYHYAPKLPDVQTLKDIKLQTPLRIYSADEKLIAEFGEKRRTPISFDQVPQTFVNALLAAEDRNFFNHLGIDVKGLARAAYQLASTGKIKSGGSTITMQVAKNYFLTRERSFVRKFNEILLSLRIEQELSKEQIFELYINKIYLGHRSYGIQAAANIYYGKNIDQLTIAQYAMIAGLPKAPSAYNPITNPTRALERRNWILKRMHSLSFIDDQAYEEAVSAPVTAEYHGTQIELYAPYVAEMVRNRLYEHFQDALYTDGLKVYTTLDSSMQAAANTALEKGLLAYTERHGYYGPEATTDDLSDDGLKAFFKKQTVYGSLLPAVVTEVGEQVATAQLKSGEKITLDWENINWAKAYKGPNRMGAAPKQASDILAVGDMIRVIPGEEENTWHLTQIPRVQGAFVALSPKDGALNALVGGFNFVHNKFNRATQALRQPGSNFKPFIYASALEQGFTPATTINDTPVVLNDNDLEASWRPENYSKKFYGPTRLREALYRSRNLVSIRILRSIGIDTATNYLTSFGFDKARIPQNLSLSLGSADVTPLELVTGYAGLANQGYKVSPYFINRMENAAGKVLYHAQPATVCSGCEYSEPATNIPSKIEEIELATVQAPATDNNVNTDKLQLSGSKISQLPIAEQIMQPQAAYMIYDIMQDVITHGTGRRALSLKRADIAGKTGTTNDQKDAWFSGFNKDVVATAWVGFDQPSTLGRREFGGSAALPIWIDFMEVALADSPDEAVTKPDGIISRRIDPETGLLAYPGQENAVFEIFPADKVPTEVAVGPGQAAGGESQTDDIF